MQSSYVHALVATLSAIWNPPGELSSRMRLELRILLGRWSAIVFVGVALPFHPAPGFPLALAYAILGIALAYTIVLRRLIAAGHPAVEDGTLPATGDVLLCAAMLPILGGFVFPFYAILYLVMLSAGIRLGFRRGMLLALSIVALDAAVRFVSGGSIEDAAYIIRTGVLLAIVPITAFLHDEAQKSEAALAQRLHDSQVLNEKLQHQATHDQLTGLANRTRLIEHVSQTLQAGGSHALLVIGIARLSEVNDTFGHDYGDVLLQQIAARLSAAIGSSGLVARVGGEQFSIFVWNTDRDRVERIAQQVLPAVSETYTIADDCTIAVNASLGVALYPDDAPNADLLLRRADIGMSVARRGMSGYSFYAADQDQNSAARLALVGALRRAIDNDELTLFYQPKLSLSSGRCVGLEALVRWIHPQRGLIPPDQFINLAEQTGIIKHLSDWVLNAAMAQHRQWRDDGLILPIAVNLSMHDLQNPNLPDRVDQLLRHWRVPAGDLQIEITESSLMVDPARALETVTRLRGLGVVIAIDDFGTGYSSLGYLKRLPVDELKIDKSFVQDLATDEDDLAIVRSTIRLGHELGLSVTAEGIENAASFSLLRDLGCDVAQGYYIGRPKPAAEIAQERLPNPVVRPMPPLPSRNRPLPHLRGRIRPVSGRTRLATDSR
jgi:diguanylate cyclase (GGDEF)-like protein